jgi:phosphate transport system protein
MSEYATRSNQHIVQAFDNILQEIARKVAEMGGLAEKQITDAVRALVEHDTELAEHVVPADPTLDTMQREIEQMAVLAIARRLPMAVDLREIIAAR